MPARVPAELGFLTAPEFVKLTQSTLATFAPRTEEVSCRHLYNWYDTQTLQPLDGTSFISSVDSGNLVASLYTLHAGALESDRETALLYATFHRDPHALESNAIATRQASFEARVILHARFLPHQSRTGLRGFKLRRRLWQQQQPPSKPN